MAITGLLFIGLFAIYTHVEKECNRCKESFIATSESQIICSKCLAAEFGVAASSAPEELETDVAIHRRMKKRQEARAEMMKRKIAAGSLFSMQGKVRCALALVLFFACSFVFMLGDSETLETPINQLEIEYQLMISVGCSLISVICLLPSFRHNKVIIGSLIILILMWGASVPFVWHARTVQLEVGQTIELDNDAQDGDSYAVKGPSLSEGDLEVFRSICEEAPRQTHYAIYMDKQTSITRSLIRESLTRLLQAEYTRAYTRGKGALFVVVNSRAPRANVTRILSRFGRVSYSKPMEKIYEVHFDADRAKMVSRYSSDVLESPQNPNFVAANLSELSCMDPMRVRAAANMLASTNVQVLRTDIKNALLEVLKDSWQSEADTYQALVEALDVYAPAGDATALQHFREYFAKSRATSSGLSVRVVRRLAVEDPEGVAEPIVQMWVTNPVAWNEIIPLLGSRAEDSLLKKVTVNSDLQTLDSSLKFFSEYGTAKAIPLVEGLSHHKDALISHKAAQTLAAIKRRNPN